MSFWERETMRSIRVVWALVCGVFLLAGLTQAAESPQVAEYNHHMTVSKKVPGLPCWGASAAVAYNDEPYRVRENTLPVYQEPSIRNTVRMESRQVRA